MFVDGFEAMRAATLPPIVVDAIERYQRVGDPDRGFIYRWAWHGLGETHLSVVPERWREHVQTTKLLMVIVNVLFDDLADVPGNELEFQASIDRLMDVEAPSRGADIDGPYFELLFELWREIEERARELPGWERYRLLWRFDYEQVFAAMRYVVLTRTYPGLDNLTEHRAFMPHSKNIMVFATLDLMTEPGAADRSAREIGLVREAAWHAQALTQIANMVVTWRREVPARDFSSRIFPLAVDHGALTRAELDAPGARGDRREDRGVGCRGAPARGAARAPRARRGGRRPGGRRRPAALRARDGARPRDGAGRARAAVTPVPAAAGRIADRYFHGMSKQIVVRLPDELVEFVDEQVREGTARSRAAFVTRALERERRRAVAERDAVILARDGDYTDMDSLAEYAVRLPRDDLEPRPR